MEKHRGKIFGIGLPKTGTLSLHTALSQLGFRSRHNPWPYHKQIIQTGNLIWEGPPLVKGTEGPDDWDALVHFGMWTFPELDRTYPGSRFIYNTRGPDAWLKSCKRWWWRMCSVYNDADTLLHNISIFGIATYNEDIFRRVYYRHRDEVFNYFSLDDSAGIQTREKILVLPIEATGKHKALAEFLGLPAPTIPYPCRNVNMEDHRGA